MKRQALSLTSLLILLLVAGSAIAQSVQVGAKIPFNFAVGKKTLPAGPYDIGRIGNGESKMLLVQFRNGSSMVILASNDVASLKAADKTKLVFNRYGNRYFLSQIWVGGETQGRQLPKTSREKEMARDAKQNFPSERVEILASLQ